jgi:predicted O-methyltransferase YrrM
MLIGEAEEIIPSLKGSFDLAFIDADKRDYPNLYELIMEKLRPGGYIIADNVLWAGKVLKEALEADKDAHGMKAFNDLVQNDERTENVLLPFQDGIMLIRKK